MNKDERELLDILFDELQVAEEELDILTEDIEYAIDRRIETLEDIEAIQVRIKELNPCRA